MKVAILLACHNRKVKTLACLESVKNLRLIENLKLDIFVLDDGSTDGTTEAIRGKYPNVKVTQGYGNYFWAGSMRLIWTEAVKDKYDGYLLLNDDTLLFDFALNELLQAHEYALRTLGKGGIYIGAVTDPATKKFSYGGYEITNKFTGKFFPVYPENSKFKSCDFANGNILFVSSNVVDSIGVLSNKFTHQLADFDYTLKAKKHGMPLLICKNYCGTCINDHGKNWLSKDHSLSDRIKYLKNPKNLAYKEYIYFIKQHYPFYLIIAFIKLWLRTLFPVIWDNFKHQESTQ